MTDTVTEASFTIPGIPAVPFDSLKPYWRNPRNITERAVDALIDSIRRYGYQQPIVVDGDGVIITGHTRYAALRRLGAREVSVLVSDLAPEKAREYRVMDNKTAEFSTWDQDALVQELRSFEDELLSTYFSDVDLRVGGLLDDYDEEVTAGDVQAAEEKIVDVSGGRETVARQVTCPSCYHQFEVRQD